MTFTEEILNGKLISVLHYTMIKDIFRTLSNISNETFCKNSKQKKIIVKTKTDESILPTFRKLGAIKHELEC